MGEKDAAKSDGAENKADGPVTVVLKLDMHCEGCAKKIKRAVRHFDGVEEVKADIENNKLTVTGKVDPANLRQRVADKTQKKVDLVSPQPKKDAAAGGGGGGDKKSDEKEKKQGKKAEEKKPKEPAVSTVVLTTPVHCDGCMRKIKRITKRREGVDSVTIDADKNLVTVKGTMDVKELVAYLKERMKQNVEIVPPKKEEGKKKASGGDKKEKEGGGGEKKDGGESKAASSGGGDGKKGEEPKVEANKLEHYGYSPYSSFYSVPVHSQGYVDQGYGIPVYQGYVHPGYNQGYHQGYANPGYHQGYANPGYGVEYSHPPPPPPPPPYMQGQMFSDENPNACSVM